MSHGNRVLREKAISIVEYALRKANPYSITKELVRLDGDTLLVGENRFDLNKHKRIYVLGAGKATYPIAKALDETLGSRITDGVVIVKHGQEGSLNHCRLRWASHPLPDECGLRAAKEVMEIVKQTKEDDIVFSISTGGATAMMPYPVEGVTLEDKQLTSKLLLRSGASLWEMNYVRSHLTQLKCGMMGKRINPKSHIINLGVADAIGQGIDDCVDTTTACFCSFDDARNVLTKYKLWDQIPSSVRSYIENGTEEQELPRDLDDHILYNYLLVDVNAAVEAAYERACELGFNSVICGGIFGDHCSPVTDCTILSSIGCGCETMDHVVTQMPYALTVAAISIVAITITSLGLPVFVSLLLGTIGITLVIWLAGKKP